MPAKAPDASQAVLEKLAALGARLRTHRRALGVSATTTAEAAGVSRMTLYRVERGEPSVAVVAYATVAMALGLALDLVDPAKPRGEGGGPSSLPKTIKLAEYPQLRKIAWQLADTHAVTPKEALALYERNWRHVDKVAMGEKERELVRQLVERLGGAKLLV